MENSRSANVRFWQWGIMGRVVEPVFVFKAIWRTKKPIFLISEWTAVAIYVTCVRVCVTWEHLLHDGDQLVWGSQCQQLVGAQVTGWVKHGQPKSGHGWQRPLRLRCQQVGRWGSQCQQLEWGPQSRGAGAQGASKGREQGNQVFSPRHMCACKLLGDFRVG